MAAETGTGPESETDDGPFSRWVTRAIANPRRVYRALFYVAAIFFIVTTLFPFYWLIVVALTPVTDLVNMGLVPKGFHWQSFVEIFQQTQFAHFVFNSLVLSTISTVIVLVLASLAGYVFGRLEFPGKRPLMLVVLAISYFPPAAFFNPLYQLFSGNVFGWLNVLNTPGALVPPYTALFMPLSIFILTTFYRQIPDGLEDAARVEGTTRLGALFRVIMPLSAPGVATAAILTFISVYNEFFFSFLMVTSGVPSNWATIVYGITNFQTQYQSMYNLMAAASIVAVLPVAILVVVAQERIVSGLTSGALKE